MKWEVTEDKRGMGNWRVEAIDFAKEGVVFVAIFSGPEAKDRALEYADWKSTQKGQLQRAS